MAKRKRQPKRKRQRNRVPVLCGSRNTNSGKPCKNTRDGCNVPSHKEPDRNRNSPQIPKGLNIGDHLKIPAPGSGKETLKSIPAPLIGLCEKTSESLGLYYNQIELDYWNTVALRDITNICSADGELTLGSVLDGEDTITPLGRVVFFGGTSLCTAWQITSRLSEDLDFLFLPTDVQHGKTAERALTMAISRAFMHKIGERLGLKRSQVSIFSPDDGFCQGFFKVTSLFRKLKIDITEDLSLNDGIYPSHTPPLYIKQSMSLMGRHATPQELEEHPELGPFPTLTITPAYSACGKFHALAGAAQANDLNKIRARARDIIDLHAIASHPQGDILREHFDVYDKIASQGPSAMGHTLRPPAFGYGELDVFIPGTPECEALRSGYQDVVALMGWNAGENIPEFEVALKAAVSLDPRTPVW